MRRINQALWQWAAAQYPALVVTPTVTSITSTAKTEGTAITHNVVLSATVGGVPATYAFDITPITASAGSDYNATPTFGSSGVTLSGGNLTVPVGVFSFPIIVATSQDAVYEGTESYSISVGGMSNTGTINDDDAAPSIFSVSSASASEGASIIHTVTVTGTAQMSRTFPISFTDGTATGGGVDYTSTLTNPNFSAGVTISGGNISVPPGTTTFSVYVPTMTDALTEGNETYTLTVGGASGTGTIIDVAAPAYSGYGASADSGKVTTPGTATAWSAIANYNAGDMVQNGGTGFWARTAVPAGTATSDTTAWQPIVLTYYVDADNGNDTTYNGKSAYLGYITNADGTQGSANAAYGPWQTLTKLREIVLSGYWDSAAPNGSTYPTNHPAWSNGAAKGTVCLLKRGTTAAYPGQLQASAWNVVLSASVGDIFYGTYGSGSRPLVNYVQSLAYYSNSGAGAWFARVGTKADDIAFDMQFCFNCIGTAGTGTLVAGDMVTGVTTGATGVFQHANGTAYTIQCTSVPTMFSNEAIQTSGGVKTATITAIASITGYTLTGTYKSVQNGSVSNALSNGILISAGASDATPPHGAVVSNMVVSNTCRYQANGAGIDGGGGSATAIADGVKVTSNTCISNGNGNRAHNMYLAWLSNGLISNNWCYQDSGIKGNHALVIHGVVTNTPIQDNLWENCNNGLGINDGYSTLDEYFDNLDIRRNFNRGHYYSVASGGQGQGLAMDLACVTNSRIYNNIHANTGLQYSFYTRRSTYSRASTNTSICHETIYNVPGGLKLQSINSAVLTGIVVKNDILMSTASSGYLLDIDSATPTGNIDLSNCLLWMPNNTGNAVNWFGTPMTIDGWLTWMNTNRPGHGCIKADPLFVNAAANDFRLQAGSPCKNAGTTIIFAYDDFAFNTRSATTPSIGAYE